MGEHCHLHMIIHFDQKASPQGVSICSPFSQELIQRFFLGGRISLNVLQYD